VGGQAKFRREEIAELKRRSPEDAARWRQMQEDKRVVASGIDPESSDPRLPVAMARAMGALFIEAKRSGNVDPPVTFLYETINATLRRISDVPVACKKGCSHCCHTWVSVAAPEALFIAKILKQRNSAVAERVRLVHEQTKEYDFDTRDAHPHPCPLLEDDACSIYDARPKVCRLAASADADICARTYHNITNEDVPIPMMHLVSRAAYGITVAAGLRHAGLPHHWYEFNAALHRALATDQAEQRWLAGEDIFADIRRDPEDVLEHEQAQYLYEHAFQNAE
jgi:Fe-S-cluster containining protein